MAGRFSLNGGAGSSLAEGGGSSPALVATESVPSRRANGRPTRARADEIKTAILQAALAEFAERGFHAGSIVGIAGRANVTRATVYNHFNNGFWTTYSGTGTLRHQEEEKALAEEGIPPAESGVFPFFALLVVMRITPNAPLAP